jgi:PAS domain S-box-containing protein
MAQRDYSFLDIAVLDEVRARFVAADAIAILSTDLSEVIWANGPGAALFGHGDIESIMGAETGLPFAARRQIMAAPGYPEIGTDRPLNVRLASGMTSRIVSFLGSRIALPGGEAAILLALPFAQGASRTPREIAARAIGGFGEAGHHVALVDGLGHVEAASEGFADLAIAPQTLETLAAEAASAGDRLVKRLITAGSEQIPAGMARLRDDPPLCLFVAVGAAEAEEEDAVAPAIVEAAAEEPASAAEPAQRSETEELPTAEKTVEEIPPAFDVVFSAEQPQPEPSPAGAPIEPAGRRAERTEEDHWYFGPGQEGPAEEEVVAEPRSGLEMPAALAPSAPPVVEEPARKVVAMPSADRAAAPVRFVWRTDAAGRFSAISSEFAAAVGDAAADVVGRSFAEVADALGLDPTGEIAGLLARRDTWSGRSLLWPIADTDLRVPVDLAALPVYGRSRDFEGFRGFGVARTADAVVDPEATGLSLGKAAAVEEETPFAAQAGSAEPAAPAAPEAAGSGTLEPAAPEPEAPARAEAPRREDPFKGEVPALTLVPKPERRFSDKIIRLAEHRPAANDRGLTPVEKNAFREIGDRLKKEGSAPAGDAAAKPSGEASTGIAETQAAEPAGPTAVAPEPETVVAPEPKRDAAEPAPVASAAAAETETPPATTEMETDDFAAVGDGEQVFETTEPQPAPDRDDLVVAAGEEAPAAEQAASPAAAEEEPAAAEEAETAAFAEARAEEPAPASVRDFLPSAFASAGGARRPAVDTSILDKLPVPVLIHSGDVLHYANREFLEFTAYESVDELAERGGLGVLFGDPYRDEGENDRADRKLRLRRGDGLELPVEALLQSVPWNGGKALLLALRKVGRMPVMAPAAGIAAEEKSELEARVAELRTIIDTATDGVVLIATDGTIRSISRPAEALFGVESADVAGKPFTALFAIESQRAARDYLNGLSENGVASVLNDGREVIGREAQGRFIPLFMTIGKLPNLGGYCAVVRDITQWKRAEEELTQSRAQAERASSQKTDFLARVSHEIRTPLNAIIGFSELMIDEKFGPIGNDRYRDYLRDINRSGNHVLDLVNDLLDISKIEAGEQEMSYEAVSLNDTLAETVAMMQPQANRERVIIRSSFASRLPEVVADLRSVRQIALNLLSNAIRFTQAGGQVVVSTAYEPSGDVVMRVRDTGIGMTTAEIEQALKPFKQISALKRGRSDGTGLGLPLTKAMVEANRARFNINSAPGEGTLVEITFPSTRVLAE